MNSDEEIVQVNVMHEQHEIECKNQKKVAIDIKEEELFSINKFTDIRSK
jgi:hypothetical protein